MKNHQPLLLMLLAFVLDTGEAAAPANGTATIRVDDNEYTVPIVCEDPSSPAAGFYTEPQRITRERTGRASGVRVSLRPWKDSGDVVVSIDRYVAWLASPPSTDGILVLSLAMSPASFLRDGLPVALTYDDWSAGYRPAGVDDVRLEADCRSLDPAAPGFRKLSSVD